MPAHGRPPIHAPTHEDGGTDEIDVTGLDGVLADPQTPAAHAGSHENGGADEISVLGLSGLLADDQNPVVHGAAEHTDVTRYLFLPTNEGFISTGTATNVSLWAAVKGLADSDEPHVFFTMKVPDDFVSFTSLQAVWISVAAAGDMYWHTYAKYGAAGESYVAHSDSPATGVTATAGNNIINVQTPQNPLILAGLAAADYIGIAFDRNGAHVSDTLNEDMYLLGLLFTYTASQ